jgi:hypothetical protein
MMYQDIILILFSVLITGILVFMGFIIKRVFSRSKQYIAKFLRMEGDRYVNVGQVRFNLDDDFVRYKEQEFPIDSKALGYIDKRKTLIFYDVDSKNQLSFKELKSNINVKLIDQLLNSKIIGQLVSRLSALQKQSYVIILVAALAAGAIGFMAGQYLAPSHTVIQYVNSTGGIPSV